MNQFTEPRLYRSGKTWYVQFYIVSHARHTRERVRITKGLNNNDLSEFEREKRAEMLLADLRAKMLHGTLDCVRVVENVFSPKIEQKLCVKTTSKDAIIALNDYLEQAKLRITWRSYQSYKSILYKFSAFIRLKYNGITYTRLTRRHLIEYLQTLANSGLSRITIKRQTQVIHNFFKWLYENEKIGQNIAVNLPTNFGVVVDEAPRPISAQNIARLKAVILPQDKQLWLACMFQYYAAIRPAELRHIRICDIDVEHKQIILHADHTKNRQNDVVRLHTNLLTFIKDLGYLEIENKSLYLFGHAGVPNFAPVAINSFYNRFRAYCEKLKLPEHITFYSWKHTGAVEAINNGMPPYELKEHLRHANFATTEIYLKNKTRLPKDNDRFFGTI